MPEIIECEEFSEISVSVSALLENGELRLDERIASKGYLAATMKGGQIALRSTRFVGTIPLNRKISVRIKPRANIKNLSYMLVRSGVIPAAIAGFSRGYMPQFVTAENTEKIFGRSLVEGVKIIARRGFAKEYVKPLNSIPWRGRLLASDTAKRHAAKGIRYRHDFEHSTLSPSTIENISLKYSLEQVRSWYMKYEKNNSLVRETSALLHELWPVSTWNGNNAELVYQLAHKVRTLPPQLGYYRDPLWAAFLILQNLLPETAFNGFVRLDSLIIDVATVFECYLRRELKVRLLHHGYLVDDGNRAPGSFFRDAGPFKVHPDIIIRKDGIIVGLLDAKYKPSPKEQDRYEVLSFMDAMGTKIGGFVCPSDGVDSTRYLGTTESGKKMFSLRYDLAAPDPEAELERLAENVIGMVEGFNVFT